MVISLRHSSVLSLAMQNNRNFVRNSERIVGCASDRPQVSNIEDFMLNISPRNYLSANFQMIDIRDKNGWTIVRNSMICPPEPFQCNDNKAGRHLNSHRHAAISTITYISLNPFWPLNHLITIRSLDIWQSVGKRGKKSLNNHFANATQTIKFPNDWRGEAVMELHRIPIKFV